jgi:hypothetical protein
LIALSFWAEVTRWLILSARRAASFSAGARLGGGASGPVAKEPGELLVDRRVPGVDLERLLVTDLGIFEAAGRLGLPRELQEALGGARPEGHCDGDDADQGDHHEQPREDQQRFPANGHRAILLWLETPYRTNRGFAHAGDLPGPGTVHGRAVLEIRGRVRVTRPGGAMRQWSVRRGPSNDGRRGAVQDRNAGVFLG